MRQVHARFTGLSGTLAHFGDSLTYSDAFWARLVVPPRRMTPEMAEAYATVRAYLRPECWDKWKGPRYGNDGGTTVLWALANVDDWLRRLNPEVVTIMFGSGDLTGLTVAEYEQALRVVTSRCLNHGTVVILTTPPPRSGHFEKSGQFAQAVRRLAQELQVPLIDYHRAILELRPDDWDGSLPHFQETLGDEYQVPTLICRDGMHPSNPHAYSDFSPESLRNNGYVLRTYLTTLVYADVIRHVLRPSWPGGTPWANTLQSLLVVTATLGAISGLVLLLERRLKRGWRV